MKCALCIHDADPNTYQEPSPSEVTYLASLGIDPESVVYCRDCFQVMQDKGQAASVVAGLFRLALQEMGHPNPDAAARALEDRLKK